MRRRLSEKNGDFEAGIANTDSPAIHRGELARRLVYSRVLRGDGLRPEPPVAASMEGAVVVSDWFHRVLHGVAVCGQLRVMLGDAFDVTIDCLTSRSANCGSFDQAQRNDFWTASRSDTFFSFGVH